MLAAACQQAACGSVRRGRCSRQEAPSGAGALSLRACQRVGMRGGAWRGVCRGRGDASRWRARIDGRRAMQAWQRACRVSERERGCACRQCGCDAGSLELLDNADVSVPQPPGNGHAPQTPECFRSMFWYTPKTSVNATRETRHGRIDWKRYFEVDTLSDSNEEDGKAPAADMTPEEKEAAIRDMHTRFQKFRSAGVDLDAALTNKRSHLH